MTRFALMLLFALALLSCAEMETTITGYSAGRPIGTHKVRQYVYGKQSTESLLFLERTMGNLDIGFAKAANLFASLVAAYIAGDVARAREVTSQMAAAGATKAQIEKARLAAQTEALQISAKGAAYKTAVGAGAPATVGTVTPP